MSKFITNYPTPWFLYVPLGCLDVFSVIKGMGLAKSRLQEHSPGDVWQIMAYKGAIHGRTLYRHTAEMMDAPEELSKARFESPRPRI